MLFLFLLFILLALDLIGRFLVKKAVEDKKPIFMLFTFLVYSLLIITLYYSLKLKNFSTLSGLWDAGTLLVSIAIGRIYFHDEINAWKATAFSLIAAGFILLLVS
jgi:multidrug transporter EmrE-like cation transporter